LTNATATEKYSGDLVVTHLPTYPFMTFSSEKSHDWGWLSAS